MEAGERVKEALSVPSAAGPMEGVFRALALPPAPPAVAEDTAEPVVVGERVGEGVPVPHPLPLALPVREGVEVAVEV